MMRSLMLCEYPNGRRHCVDGRQVCADFLPRAGLAGGVEIFGPLTGVQDGGSLAGNDSIDASATSSLSSGAAAESFPCS
jgi:hypothetical protein